MAKLICNCCGRKRPAERVFVYEDDNYCFCCCSKLVYEMASEGYLSVEDEDKKNKGVLLEW